MRAGCIDNGGKDEISDEPEDRAGERTGKMPEVVARIPVAVMEERAVQTDRHRAKGAEPHYWQRDGADRLRKDVLEAIPLGEKTGADKQQDKIEQLNPEKEASRQVARRFHGTVNVASVGSAVGPQFCGP